MVFLDHIKNALNVDTMKGIIIYGEHLENLEIRKSLITDYKFVMKLLRKQQLWVSSMKP